MKRFALALMLTAAVAWADRVLVGDAGVRVDFPYYGGGGYEAMRCLEVVRKTDGLLAGDVKRWEWSGGETEEIFGKFSKFRVHLCHTSRAEAAPPFNSNYEGRTPTLVFSADPVTVNMRIREWFGFDCQPAFSYDGRLNLLVEVRWEGDDNTGGRVFAADVPAQARCLLAYRKDGQPVNGYPDQGKAFNWLHYMRVTISPITVGTTSWGRVKALYR
ncbi:MAG: hypothetical protein JSU81_10310 [Candidatus Coatesbacteria bacterium]|nr:MAG: hypothetical protein JSU81_10310 [Candidatus Coatesbacteria bacterium]